MGIRGFGGDSRGIQEDSGGNGGERDGVGRFNGVPYSLSSVLGFSGCLGVLN